MSVLLGCWLVVHRRYAARIGQSLENLVTAGLDPAVHADVPQGERDDDSQRGDSAWIAGSSPAMTK
jgi:hypothetical protein